MRIKSQPGTNLVSFEELPGRVHTAEWLVYGFDNYMRI